MSLDDMLWRLRRRHGDYLTVFESPQGKRVLADLRRFCLMDHTVEGLTPERTNVNIGQRNVFLHIQRCLKDDPEELAKRLKEAESE